MRDEARGTPDDAKRDAGRARDFAKDVPRHPGRDARVAGHEIGKDAKQHPKAVAGGAATGAAGGALVGGPPGAVAGGLFGAIRGLAAADVLDILKKHVRRQ